MSSEVGGRTAASGHVADIERPRFSADRREAAQNELRLTFLMIELAESVRSVFQRVKFERSENRYVEARRTVVHESEPMPTPFLSDGQLDFDAISRFLAYHQELSGMRKADVDAGTVALAGPAGRAGGSRRIGRLLADEAGAFVSVSTAESESGQPPEIQLSGDSIFISRPQTLPLYDVPLIGLGVDQEQGSLDSDSVASAVQQRFVELAANRKAGPIGVYFRWCDSFSAARLDALTHGLANGLGHLLQSDGPLVLVSASDVGGLVGIRLHEEIGEAVTVISVDAVRVQEPDQPDMVDIGPLIVGTGTVPVTIKSLDLPDATAGSRRKSDV